MRLVGVSGFDFDAVFERIPRNRVRSFVQSEDGKNLTIVSDCTCYVSAFLWKSDKLVIDIRDGSPPENSPFNGNIDEPVLGVELPILTEQTLTVQPVLELVTERQENPDQLNELERIVSEGIGRAATQGLLQKSSALLTNDAELSDVRIAINRPGLLAHTSFDRLPDVGLPTVSKCLGDEFFAVSEWGSSDKKFHQHIAELRGAVVGEFDRSNAQAVEGLAKGFLYYGFGQEARNALTIDKEKSVARNILIAIAGIIDNDISSDSLSQQANCDSPAALWVLLSAPDLGEIEVDRNVVLRAFKSLPRHLQNHLGPRLSERFLQLGDLGGAEVALMSVGLTDDPTIEGTLANTDLQVELGKKEVATDMLETLAVTENRATPEALIDYFTIALETGAAIDPEAIGLADILRFELRGSENIDDLVAAQIKALIASEDTCSWLF